MMKGDFVIFKGPLRGRRLRATGLAESEREVVLVRRPPAC
jgi:hypothetical protein